jgi:poly(3-hydroxybutyrate) depolymerase
MRSLRTYGALVAGVALAALGVVVAPTASAGAPHTGSDSYTFTNYDCGYPIDVTGTSSWSVKGRTVPRDPTTFFDHQLFSFREVWTNPATGAWLVFRGDALTLDVKATKIEGNIYEYTTIYAGMPYVVEDSTGKVVARDRGRIRFRVVWDTGGDSDPNREFVDFLGLTIAGPHPTRGVDNCRYAGDLISSGSTSSQRYTVHPVGTTAAALGYGEYLPPSYGGAPSPLVVFLHGSGESGDGSADALSVMAGQAVPKYIVNDGWPDNRPFVVLAPQHNASDANPAYMGCDGVEFPGSCYLTTQHNLGNPPDASVCFTPREVHDFIAYALSTYDIDPTRVYLTGLSCGGYGTWEYLSQYAGSQVTAAVPIAGEGRPAWETAGCQLADVPLWAFHGALDDTVNPAGSAIPVAGLRTQCGVPNADAGLTVYPDRDHDSWNITYSGGGPVNVWDWMLTHAS